MSKEGGVATFTYGNKKYEINITYGFARKVLHKDFGINLLNLFEGSNLDELTIKLSLNDEFLLDIWWHFIKDDWTNKDAAIDKLTPDDVTEFREALWAAIINFFDPTRRAMLLEIRKHVKDLLMETLQTNLRRLESSISDSPSSSSSEKQELTQTV